MEIKTVVKGVNSPHKKRIARLKKLIAQLQTPGRTPEERLDALENAVVDVIEVIKKLV